jgi:hypothetical protein
MKIINNRYTAGQGVSQWMIQGDNPGSGAAAIYRTINGTVAGSQSFTITQVSTALNQVVFDITLNDSYAHLFIEASAWSYGQNTTTLTYVQN